MNPGKSQKPARATQFQPGALIVAEIAFAALLLYLTNHPINLSELTQASNAVDDSTVEIPAAVFVDPATGLEVAARTIEPIGRTLVARP